MRTPQEAVRFIKEVITSDHTGTQNCSSDGYRNRRALNSTLRGVEERRNEELEKRQKERKKVCNGRLKGVPSVAEQQPHFATTM